MSKKCHVLDSPISNSTYPIHSNTKFQARGDLIGYHSDRGRYGRLRKGFYGNSPRKLVMLTFLGSSKIESAVWKCGTSISCYTFYSKWPWKMWKLMTKQWIYIEVPDFQTKPCKKCWNMCNPTFLSMFINVPPMTTTETMHAIQNKRCRA